MTTAGHDARCDTWTSGRPDTCDCRDEHGHTTHLADQRLEARHAAEQEWAQLTPCQRADEYDRIAQIGA